MHIWLKLWLPRWKFRSAGTDVWVVGAFKSRATNPLNPAILDPDHQPNPNPDIFQTWCPAFCAARCPPTRSRPPSWTTRAVSRRRRQCGRTRRQPRRTPPSPCPRPPRPTRGRWSGLRQARGQWHARALVSQETAVRGSATTSGTTWSTCDREIIFVTYPAKNLKNFSPHQKHCQNDNHCKEYLISYWNVWSTHKKSGYVNLICKSLILCHAMS